MARMKAPPAAEPAGAVMTAEAVQARPAGEDEAGLPAWLRPFRALRHRQFRYLWLGQVASTNGLWMDQVTRGWLVYQLTGSAAQLAFASAVRTIPLLFFALVTGVFADRFDRRRLLMSSQWLNVGLNLLLGGLVLTGMVEVWHVYATGLLGGVGQAVQQPARQAMLPALVPRADLQNAVVLNSGTLNIGQALGPALGGVLVAGLGMGWTYVAQAGIYLVAVAATSVMVSPPVRARREKESVLASIGGGLAYVRRNEVVLALLLLALVPMFFGSPHASLVPLFAADILHVGPRQTGLLLAATGIGSVVSLCLLAALPMPRRTGRMLIAGAMLYGLAVVLFAASSAFLLSWCFLFLAGLTRAAYRTVNHTMLLAETDEAYLGRVNSMYLLDRGLVPLGTLLLGVLAEVMGAPHAVVLMGALCAVLSAGSVAVSRRLWQA